MLEDAVLIWRFNHGQPEVAHRIYDKYKADLLTLARAILNDAADAEDVVHDVFISFLKSSGRFRLTGSLKDFLITCVINAARGIKRTNRRHRTVDIDQVGPITTEADMPDHVAAFSERLLRLEPALGQLPYEQREALALRVYGQMKFRDIGKHQGVSANTAMG